MKNVSFIITLQILTSVISDIVNRTARTLLQDSNVAVSKDLNFFQTSENVPVKCTPPKKKTLFLREDSAIFRM